MSVFERQTAPLVPAVRWEGLNWETLVYRTASAENIFQETSAGKDGERKTKRARAQVSRRRD